MTAFLVITSDIDVKVILELMHHRKLETSSTLQALYDNMKKEFEIELSMLEFCKWTAANASVVTPVLMLQLKIRKQIIGENFWLKLTNARKQDSIKGKLEFVSKLRKIVHDKNEKYRQRLVENRINGLRVNSTEKLSAGSQNVKRKESFLLKAFNMAPNAPKGRSPGNAEVYPDDKKDEVGTPKSELREKPSPVISSSSKKRIKDGSSRKLHDKEGSDNRISEDEAVIRRNSGSSRDLNKKMRSSKSSKKLETKDKSMRKLESSKKLGELKVNKSQKMKLKG